MRVCTMLLFSSQTSPVDAAWRAYVKTRSHFPNVRITNSETLMSSLNLTSSPFKYNGPGHWTQNTYLISLIKGGKYVRLRLSGTSEIPGIVSTWGSLLIIWYLFVSLRDQPLYYLFRSPYGGLSRPDANLPQIFSILLHRPKSPLPIEPFLK